MTQKFTESIAYFDRLKQQLDSKEIPVKEMKSVELKNYGSIKRSQAVGQGHMTPYVPGYVPKSNRSYEECEIKEKF